MRSLFLTVTCVGRPNPHVGGMRASLCLCDIRGLFLPHTHLPAITCTTTYVNSQHPNPTHIHTQGEACFTSAIAEIAVGVQLAVSLAM